MRARLEQSSNTNLSPASGHTLGINVCLEPVSGCQRRRTVHMCISCAYLTPDSNAHESAEISASFNGHVSNSCFALDEHRSLLMVRGRSSVLAKVLQREFSGTCGQLDIEVRHHPPTPHPRRGALQPHTLPGVEPLEQKRGATPPPCVERASVGLTTHATALSRCRRHFRYRSRPW